MEEAKRSSTGRLSFAFQNDKVPLKIAFNNSGEQHNDGGEAPQAFIPTWSHAVYCHTACLPDWLY